MMKIVYFALPLFLLLSGQSTAWGYAPQDNQPRLELSADTSASTASFTKKDIYTMGVRPNCGELDLYVQVKNASDSPKPYYITASFNNKIIAAASAAQLAANAVEVVRLKPLTPATEPKAAETKGSEAKPTFAGTAITAQDPIVFKAFYSEADSKNDKLKPVTLNVQCKVLSPADYLTIDAKIVANPESSLGKLVVTIKPTGGKNLLGPPCKLELDLSNVVGLSGDPLKDATLQTELGPDMEQVVLGVNDARLAADVKKLGGFFGITADGVRRAYIFTTELEPNTTPQKVNGTDLVRVKVEKGAGAKATTAKTIYIKPSKDQKVTARLEVDNPSTGMQLEYGFDRSGTGVYEAKRFPVTRDQKMTFQVGKEENEGTLRFAAVLQDHEVLLNTVEGTAGNRSIQLRLVNNSTATVPFVQSIVFDPNPPTISAFDSLTKEPRKAGKVKLAVNAASLSNIDRVYFYLGDPPATEAAANKWVAGKPTAGQAGRYEAELQLPDQKGPLTLGVRVINGVGEKMDKSMEIMVTEMAPAAAAAAKLGKIRATVTQYTGETPQPNLPVAVRDAKGEVVQTGKTNDKGQVVFEKLPPGKYLVSSAKAFDRSAGTVTVEVKAEEEAKADISLKRGGR